MTYFYKKAAKTTLLILLQVFGSQHIFTETLCIDTPNNLFLG